MLMRHGKAYSSSCSHIALVYLQPYCRSSLLKCVMQSKIAKNKETPYFWSSGSFKVINVDKTKMLITRACCDRPRQHIHAYFQPFSW